VSIEIAPELVRRSRALIPFRSLAVLLRSVLPGPFARHEIFYLDIIFIAPLSVIDGGRSQLPEENFFVPDLLAIPLE
jgi:hypothetical protein